MKIDWHDVIGIPEASGYPRLFRELSAEFLGTLFIVFFGCGSVLSPAFSPEVNVVQVSLTFGLVVFAGIVITGPVSGGHLNPAVTLAATASRRIGIFKGFLYTLVQCVGAIVGAGILFGLTPGIYSSVNNLGANGVWSLKNTSMEIWHAQCMDNNCTGQFTDVSPTQGLGIEIMATMILVLVVLTVTESSSEISCPPLAIGLTVALCHLLAIPYTGCSINPARSLGPALVSGVWDHHWIFVVGPSLGAILATITYKLLFEPKITERYEVNSTPPERRLPEGKDNVAMDKL